MHEQESENYSEFTAYDLKSHSISEIPQLDGIQYSKIENIRIMHSPSLNLMKVHFLVFFC